MGYEGDLDRHAHRSQLFKLLLNGTSVEVANGRDVSTSTIVLNGGPAAVAGAVVIEMGMATGMR